MFSSYDEEKEMVSLTMLNNETGETIEKTVDVQEACKGTVNMVVGLSNFKINWDTYKEGVSHLRFTDAMAEITLAGIVERAKGNDFLAILLAGAEIMLKGARCSGVVGRDPVIESIVFSALEVEETPDVLTVDQLRDKLKTYWFQSENFKETIGINSFASKKILSEMLDKGYVAKEDVKSFIDDSVKIMLDSSSYTPGEDCGGNCVFEAQTQIDDEKDCTDLAEVAALRFAVVVMMTNRGCVKAPACDKVVDGMRDLLASGENARKNQAEEYSVTTQDLINEFNDIINRKGSKNETE